MKYFAYDREEEPLRSTLEGLEHLLLGLVGVNASFDSGRVHDSELPKNWTFLGNSAVSTPIIGTSLRCWPLSHDEYCDEWYFFKEVPKEFHVRAFCNYLGVRIKDWKQLEFEGGLYIKNYLHAYTPQLVIGNNQWTYVLASEPIETWTEVSIIEC